ncbi:YopX family protein [Brevibacillus laterosporus]|uniref:YopX family protein n=1 Tax=Brevibacillus halotolerans TaxID=1507437 RepID=A0ABT4I3R1_9BACL|nr:MULTISPECIES: YopX family protein [Brevibacillus]MCR8987908.1 YopX family protein [Brevibacillus laterosporus]MCZ0833647.1 YopX family protein [Brevibacillus halotolerans]
MREIKFRAWDDVSKVMSFSTFEQFDDMMGFRFSHFETEKPIYMQYTGIKDCNGKEIYEGDIVQIDNTDEVSWWVRGEKALVEYKPGRFRTLIKSGEAIMMREDMSDVIEVIGISTKIQICYRLVGNDDREKTARNSGSCRESYFRPLERESKERRFYAH